MRRVVVTGLGIMSPLGSGIDYNWSELTNGKSGVGKITSFDASEISSRIAGEVPIPAHGITGDHVFDVDKLMPAKEQRKMDRFIHFGIAAADDAIADAGWAPTEEEDLNRTGVMIGSGIGGLPHMHKTAQILHEKGPRRISPFFIPSVLSNMTSGQVSIKYKFKGPNHAVVTACATGTHAIGDAARMIMLDDADVMIAGGAEAAISMIGVGGFAACRALSTHYNDTPEQGSRPFDKDRDGFVISEGAGVIVLEELEHAKARGAKIYGEVIGYGLSGDGYHMTSPAPDGSGGYRSMEAAFKRAKINPSDVDYINAHGTSTPMGDDIEVTAVKRLFGSAVDTVSMSSTKSSIGHLLGAAGAVEAIFALKAIETNTIPPTLNLDNPSEPCLGIDLVPHTAKDKTVNTVLSNSFGFGGTNASLIFRAL